MALEKTLQLLKQLNKGGISLLERELESSRNKKMEKLHFFCMNKRAASLPTNKIAIYKAVFSGMYTQSKDYLLRNEIRRYNDLIKEIIAWTYLKRDQQLLRETYLKGLKSGKANKLYRSELTHELKSNDNRMNYHRSAELHAMLTQHLLDSQEYTLAKFKEIEKSLLSEIDAIHFAWNDNLSEAILKLSYTNRVFEQLNPEKESKDLKALRNPESRQSDFAVYNNLRALTYQSQDPHKIENLNKMIDILTELDHPKINKEASLASAYASLALEHLLQSEYQDAVLNFELCSQYKKSLSTQQWSGISLNYLSSICKLGDFVKAKEFIENTPEILENIKDNDRILPIVIGVYIMIGDIEKAEKLLPHNLKEGEYDAYHYMRILLAIIHYENGLMELAETELLNLRKHLYKLDRGKYKFTLEVNQLVLDLVTAKFAKLPEEFTIWIKSFKAEMHEMRTRYGDFQMDGIITSWLYKQIT